MDQVFGIAVLAQFPVHPALDGQGRREVEFIRRNDAGSHGGKGVQALSEVPLLVGHLHVPGGYIVDDGIAEHVIRRVLFFHILGFFPDDHGQFTFIVQFLHHVEMAVDGALRIHCPVHPFGEVHGHLALYDFFRHVFIRQFIVVGFVVDPQADNVVPGMGNGRQDLHLIQRNRPHVHPGNGQQFFKVRLLDQIIHTFILVGRDHKFPVFGNDPHLYVVVIFEGYDFHGAPLPCSRLSIQNFIVLCIHCTMFVIKLPVYEGNLSNCKP